MERREVLEALLARHPDLSRDEPEVAANIGAQMSHMGMAPLPLAVLRRLRDIAVRREAKHVIEVGAGIGHLTAWLLDAWSETDSRPAHYDVLEEGGKFGVILHRCVDRYEAGTWARPVVGPFSALMAATDTWEAAHRTLLEAAATEKPPMHRPHDLAIIAGQSGRLDALEGILPHMAKNGLILTLEPAAPTADVGKIPSSGELTPAQAEVVEFNRWIRFIQQVSTTHEVAFVPLHGGTLVAILAP